MVRVKSEPRRRSKKDKAEELAQLAPTAADLAVVTGETDPSKLMDMARAVQGTELARDINLGLEAGDNEAQALLESRPPDQVAEEPPADAWDNETKSMLAPSPGEDLDPPPHEDEDESDGTIDIGQSVLDKAEAFDRIVTLSEEVDRLKVKAEVLQKRYKSAKNAWEARVEDLQRLIKKSTEKLPLFDGIQDDDEPEDEDFDDDLEDDGPDLTDQELSQAARRAEAKRAETEAALKEPDGWKRVPINYLVVKHDLPLKIQDVLKAGKVETVGDLAEYTALGKELGDIKGLTANRREQLDASMDRFWATFGKADEVPVEKREEAGPVPSPQTEPQPQEASAS